MKKINQKSCRTILSVNKKTSRLAVLGELARYPIFIPSLAQCLSYKLSLHTRQVPSSLLGHVMTEMGQMSEKGQDCWLTRVNKIEQLLKIPKISGPAKTRGGGIDKYFKKQILAQQNKQTRLGLQCQTLV